MATFLHTMVRIADPERSRGFYEALGFRFSREMDIVRDGELEATNYFFSLGDAEDVLELTYNHDGRSYELGTGYGHIAVGVGSEVAVADRWAGGFRHRAHSIKTQERVFRMAEQLAGQGVDRQGLFNNLVEADRSVATADAPDVVRNAGYRAIAPLLPLADVPIFICGDNRPPDLGAFGFETIPFATTRRRTPGPGSS